MNDKCREVDIRQLSEYRVQRSRVAEVEVEDDYGTNPTHEPTETRCRGNGNRRRTNGGKRNERDASRSTTTLKPISPVFIVQGELDLFVRATATRTLVKNAKAAGLKVSYHEVAGGSHLEVAWDSLSKIIYFYNLHRRKQAAQAVPNAPPVIEKPTVVR